MTQAIFQTRSNGTLWQWMGSVLLSWVAPSGYCLGEWRLVLRLKAVIPRNMVGEWYMYSLEVAPRD